MRLRGKTVVISGAGHGLGRAYARRCAKEGASVVLFDVDGPAAERVGREVESEGGEVLARQLDVRDLPGLRTLAAETTRRFGPVHGLVNNAGILSTIAISRVPFEQIPEAEWDAVFDTNIKGMWLACRAFVPLMRSQGGSIINVSSSTVLIGGPTRVHYVASKAAVIGFTRVLSRELGSDGIRVNTLMPGSTLSESDPSPQTLKMREAAIAQRAIKRVQVPEDLEGAVVFLLSDDSAFMTAQTVAVDGGVVLT
jgi:3-oxoacyl-[acyl-carrier protein] reductase